MRADKGDREPRPDCTGGGGEESRGHQPPPPKGTTVRLVSTGTPWCGFPEGNPVREPQTRLKSVARNIKQ